MANIKLTKKDIKIIEHASKQSLDYDEIFYHNLTFEVAGKVVYNFEYSAARKQTKKIVLDNLLFVLLRQPESLKVVSNG